MDHGDGNYKPSPDELKLTPNSAMEIRLRSHGDRRPLPAAGATTPDMADRKPVNLKKFRNRTENLFSMVFGAIAVLMVVGALGVLWFVRTSGAPRDVTAEVGDAAPPAEEAGEEKELQGGVKVRKGFGG